MTTSHTSAIVVVRKAITLSNAGKSRRKVGKTCVGGVEDGEAHDPGAEVAQDPGDLEPCTPEEVEDLASGTAEIPDMCVVKNVWEVGAGHTSVDLSDDLPPGLMDLDKFDLLVEFDPV